MRQVSIALLKLVAPSISALCNFITLLIVLLGMTCEASSEILSSAPSKQLCSAPLQTSTDFIGVAFSVFFEVFERFVHVLVWLQLVVEVPQLFLMNC